MKTTLFKTLSILLAASLFLFGTCCLVCFTPAVNAELTEYDVILEMISQISTAEIYSTVSDLQGFMTRRYGTTGNLEAAAYIYNRLSSLPRLDVEYQSKYNNVIATMFGVDNTSTAIYVVGAHYDSISSDPSYAPGATDNGGGVAIVLEFARIMSQYTFNHTVKFAFWNDEEDGMLGSIEYAKYVQAEEIDVQLYLNFDSSCYDPDGRMILGVISNQFSNWVSEMMTYHNGLYGINFTLTYNSFECYSDHVSFWEYGYQAITTHSESYGPAHSPQDTIDAVSTVYAQKNGQLGMSVIATLAEVVNSEIPEFTSVLAPLVIVIASSAAMVLAKTREKERL